MPKYKTQTNDLTEVIEAGGGGGKLYMHTLKFFNSSMINTPNDEGLINQIVLYIICSSPVLLNSWREYQDLLVKNQTNQFLYIPCSYSYSYPGSQKTIISSVSTYVYNGTYSKSLTTVVNYFKIGSTDTNLSSVTDSNYSVYYNKEDSYVRPLG